MKKFFGLMFVFILLAVEQCTILGGAFKCKHLYFGNTSTSVIN